MRGRERKREYQLFSEKVKEQLRRLVELAKKKRKVEKRKVKNEKEKSRRGGKGRGG